MVIIPKTLFFPGEGELKEISETLTTGHDSRSPSGHEALPWRPGASGSEPRQPLLDPFPGDQDPERPEADLAGE